MSDNPDMKTTAGKIENLGNLLAQAAAPMGEDVAAATREAGRLTARDRVLRLVDEGSFVETDALARHRSKDFGREHDRPATDGVVTGYGTISGQKVCVFSQDVTVFDGTVGEVYGDKLTKLYDLALKTGVPVVGIYESAGPRVQEGIVTLAMYSRIMARMTAASGLIPQVAVVVGDNEGMAAFPPVLADVVVVSQDGALHQATPKVVEQVFGDADATVDKLGGAAVHATESGTAHLVADSDAHAIDVAREVLEYFPANNRAEAARTAVTPMAGSIADNITDADRALDSIIPDADQAAYDMADVIRGVVDEGSFYELSAEYAPNLITGFARIEGRVVGVVANQPMVQAGALDTRAAEKGARFIRTCDAFNTPIVEFVDSPGFIPSPEEERAGLLRRGAKLAYAFAEASVGTLTVITRKAIGPAYVMMGSKDLGADLVYAWPTADIAVAQASVAAEAIYGEPTEEQVSDYAEKHMGPYLAAERGLADAVIEPSATRGHLIEGLRLLERKITPANLKKHGNLPL